RAGVEGWIRMAGLEMVDDRSRADHDLAPEAQHGDAALTRQPPDRQHVRGRQKGPAGVTHRLEVEPPARLLVVVGEAKLEQLGGHRARSPASVSTHATRMTTAPLTRKKATTPSCHGVPTCPAPRIGVVRLVPKAAARKSPAQLA